MIKVEDIQVFNFEGAVRGMRNPLNSWAQSDSFVSSQDAYGNDVVIGRKDLDLMRRLYKAGNEHRKYLRQIFVSIDITAPLYWWKEFDTYKIGTTANSCSTMHKIADKDFELSDFSTEHLSGSSLAVFNKVIDELNYWRHCYLPQKNKVCWWQLIQLLPSSYNQKRTITMNYENVMQMIHQRTGHKLDEWNEFIKILKKLPYIKEIMDVEE